MPWPWRKPGGRIAVRHQRGPLGSHSEHPAVRHCTEIRGTGGLGRTHKTPARDKQVSLQASLFTSIQCLSTTQKPGRQAYPIWKQHRAGSWEQNLWVPSSERSQEVGMMDQIERWNLNSEKCKLKCIYSSKHTKAKDWKTRLNQRKYHATKYTWIWVKPKHKMWTNRNFIPSYWGRGGRR